MYCDNDKKSLNITRMKFSDARCFTTNIKIIKAMFHSSTQNFTLSSYPVLKFLLFSQSPIFTKFVFSYLLFFLFTVNQPVYYSFMGITLSGTGNINTRAVIYNEFTKQYYYYTIMLLAKQDENETFWFDCIRTLIIGDKPNLRISMMIS